MNPRSQSNSKCRHNQPFSPCDHKYGDSKGQSMKWPLNSSRKETPYNIPLQDKTNKIDFYHNQEYLKQNKPRYSNNMNQSRNYFDYLNDSEDDQNFSIKDCNLINDSDDIKQRISHLIRKTRINKKQRKNLTGNKNNKENAYIDSK